ncbi:MAG: cytochrome c oxidase subunit 3 family protein [Candidatus Eisenbacteria bacterium]|uniref:Cytochrome c oxidase subunit 3 family protein n=1 Tax=Eiseniibacteriota bacterium TaxID=2212470 RepID=A0A7Y2H391_UNCEI|nr:cytochrome c oxidase subunit 3 family protein [Candidatus Eisenbacteria bacterium]
MSDYQHHVGHHFEHFEQELASNKLGFWLFLATEILMFGGLFVAYAVFSNTHAEMWEMASGHLDRIMGGTNTVVLIVSSLTMALAVRSAQTNNRQATGLFLIATFALAAVFMVIKYFEYSAKFEHGLLPGEWYTPHGADTPAQGNIFFGLYFMTTGLHGVHVLIGMIVIAWLWVKNAKGQFSSAWYTPVEIVGLYWHLVDLVWIFLFPLYYLV